MPINESDKNKDAMKMLLSDLRAHQKEARLGGGEKSLKRHKAKGKMTARERIDALLDDPKTALEMEPLQEKTCTLNMAVVLRAVLLLKLASYKIRSSCNCS